MKSNKEKVYDFIKLHTGGENNGGVSTVYIAEALDLQRTNVSSILNRLVEEKRVEKLGGRPVLYSAVLHQAGSRGDCFTDFIGNSGSLKQVVQLARIAVLYPQRSLNSLIVGARGTGKSRLAKKMYEFALEQEVLPTEATYVMVDCHDYYSDEEKNGEHALTKLLHELSSKEIPGVVYFDNIQFLNSKERKPVLEYIQAPSRKAAVIVSCTEKTQLADEFLAEFPIQMELPALAERPLAERLEMIQQLILKEASRIHRTLIVRGDLMRCLLLYECEANYYQLKGDIKIGCANAYIREHGSKEDIQLFVGDFSNAVRKGFLRYQMHREEIDALVSFGQQYIFDGNKGSVTAPKDGSLYDRLDEKASALTDTGLDSEEINMILSDEVERSLGGYRKETKLINGKPVILFAFYGEQIATAVARTIQGMTQADNVYAFELAYEKASAETYDNLKQYIMEIHQGNGVIVVYDSCFLPEMLREIENESGIIIRQMPMPVATIGMELAKRTLTENNIDEVLRRSKKSMEAVGAYTRNYIVTLCTTGKGGAEELKRYIERYGQLKDTEVIPLSVNDRTTLEEAFKNYMRKGMISCVVGTFNPQLFDIPFIPISDVFSIKKENLPRLLRLEKEAKTKIDYNAMFDYLGEQLEHISMEKLKKILPETLKEINAEITELSLDTEAGLLIHLSCCADRLAGKQPTAANPRKKAILSRYERDLKKLLKILKPLEKAFHIIVNDDEIANILTIIYQL